MAGAFVLAAQGCGDDGIGPPPMVSDTGVQPDASMPDTGPLMPPMFGLSVANMVPDHGPFTGGSRSIVRGTGFTEETFVTIGGRMVQPADIEFIDDNRVAVVVPAGEVGPADVTVMVGDDEATLPDGFYYDAFYVEPNRGSVSGGTNITITGSGTMWADGDTVIIGRTPCEDIVVVSETQITCKTPPLAAGTVDVTIVDAEDESELTVEDAYTYYDSTDPFAGGLGGGPLMGDMNVTVLNAGSGGPVPDAFVLVGEDVMGEHQGLTDLRGQISFSGDDLVGDHTVHVAKDCFENTSVVAFDAQDVTVFLVPLMDPRCGMGGPPPPGRGRNGTTIAGELVWRGPREFGPNPWNNIPDPRADEVKVAYVYTTQRSVEAPNPDPSLGGAMQRVLEVLPPEDEEHLGYPYRIFARPAGLAVFALAGLENTSTGEFIPYVMGVARNVLGGPGEDVTGVDVYMDIPLDHTVDVELSELPAPARAGPDRFRVEAYIDLGGEGVIVRHCGNSIADTNCDEPSDANQPLDVVRDRNADRPFRFWAQPALLGALSDGRYRIVSGWYNDEFEAQPYTVVARNGVRDVSSPVQMNGFLGIPQATNPVHGGRITPEDRVLRWDADGADPDLHIVLVIGGDGNPAWRHFAPGSVREAPIPDFSSIPDLADIGAGFVTWVVFAVGIPGFDFNEFSYNYLNDRFWEKWSLDFFIATR